MPTPLLTHRLEVRFRDCDAFGHVNNAVYFTYFEQARASLWKTLGLSGFRDTDTSGVSVILAHAECDFRAPARFGDVLDVRLALEAIGRTSFTYGYEIISVPDGRTIATGRTVQVIFDYARRTPVEISADLRDKLSEAPSGSTTL
jgi:acyl-CoA thioester hydrolase